MVDEKKPGESAIVGDNEALFAESRARLEGKMEADPELRAMLPSAEVSQEMLATCQTSIELLQTLCKRYGARRALGSRRSELIDGQVRFAAAFDYITYAELWRRIEAVAAGLRQKALARTGDIVGIMGFGSPDWLIADFACLHQAVTAAALQTTLPPADLSGIINEAELRTIICSLESLGSLTSVLPDCPTVRHIIVMDVDEHDPAALAAVTAFALGENSSVAIGRLSDVLAAGAATKRVAPVIPGKTIADDNPLLGLIYTSGSTGRPKGAMYPEKLVAESFRAPLDNLLPALPMSIVSYLPMNHLAGRYNVMQSLMNGGIVSFTRASDMSTLFEDIAIARPTALMLVPRVGDMIFQHFQAERLRRTPTGASADVQRRIEVELTQEMRFSYLGDRLASVITGTAPMAPQVLQFIRACFRVPVFNAYGATENGSVTFEDRITRQYVTDYKLVDVPELGYTRADKPYPRGELRIKSSRLIPGYYKNPAATADLLDEDGYMKTGDIVEERSPDHVVWVDRKRNILKLSQGEFVSVSHLESIYSDSPYIQQIYIYGNSMRSFLLAVVVPSYASIASQFNASADDVAAIKGIVRAELNRLALAHRLPSYEIPRDFLVERAPFTKENGLLTESNKPSRPRLKAHFSARLEDVYAAMETQQLEALRALRSTANATIADKVKIAIEVTLGLQDVNVSKDDRSFATLGGDSLSAVRLSQLLEETCGVPVPVSTVLDSTLSLRGLVDKVEQRAKDVGERVSFADIHGHDAKTIHARDMQLSRLLPEAAALAEKAAPLSKSNEVVLLTGANGFLGRALLMNLLRRAREQQRGRIICIVRARDDANARQRLRDGYDTSPELLYEFDTLAGEGRLAVYAGDLVRHHLGLEADAYETLCKDVDVILHNGALVNHALAYDQLFEPNVLGTVEMIRLALTGKRKHFTFVSTVGVFAGAGRANIDETQTASALGQSRPVSEGYAAGYGTSKWASELLLEQLQRTYAVPVNIARCSLIMAHASDVGQVNQNDMVTRLFAGIIDTGMAPRSFYELGFSGSRHFDGTPVDIVAQGISEIATGRGDGLHVYHVVNARWDDGVSLDKFVDWMSSAGYRVQRVDDYMSWLNGFRERLQALPEPAKRRSPLAILDQWERPIAGQIYIDNAAFRGRLQELTGRDDVPSLSEAYIHQYLRHMAQAGLIDKARQARRVAGIEARHQ